MLVEHLNYKWYFCSSLYKKNMKQIKVFVAAALFIAGSCFTHVQAQSLKDILGGIASSVTSKVEASSASVIGTWKYVQPAVKLESDNVLAQLGGKVAASKVEEQLKEQVDKYGLSKIGCTFTFNQDKTFSYTIGKITRQGTYTIDTNKKQIVMKPRIGKKQTASYELSGNKLSVYMQADGVIKLLQGASALASQATSNSALSILSSLSKQYDGMELGVELKKQ